MAAPPFRPARLQGVLQVTLFVDPALEDRWFVELSFRQMINLPSEQPPEYVADVDQVCRQVRSWLLERLERLPRR